MRANHSYTRNKIINSKPKNKFQRKQFPSFGWKSSTIQQWTRPDPAGFQDQLRLGLFPEVWLFTLWYMESTKHFRNHLLWTWGKIGELIIIFFFEDSGYLIVRSDIQLVISSVRAELAARFPVLTPPVSVTVGTAALALFAFISSWAKWKQDYL